MPLKEIEYRYCKCGKVLNTKEELTSGVCGWCKKVIDGEKNEKINKETR